MFKAFIGSNGMMLDRLPDLRFIDEGEYISGDETPKMWDMNDNDQVFVIHGQTGC